MVSSTDPRGVLEERERERGGGAWIGRDENAANAQADLGGAGGCLAHHAFTCNMWFPPVWITRSSPRPPPSTTQLRFCLPA